MAVKRFAGLAGVVGVSAVAMIVSADDCFENRNINSCDNLVPSFPSWSNCVVPVSNNSCMQAFPGSALDQVGSPTTSTCRFRFGEIDEHGVCIPSGMSQDATVQCSPAVGSACSGGGPD